MFKKFRFSAELQTPLIDSSQNSHKEPRLMNKNKKPPKNSSSVWWRRLLCLQVGSKTSSSDRKIWLNGKVIPKNDCKNAVCNQKYSFLSFFPVVLFNQFRYFYNFFFLIIAFSQFLPILQVGIIFNYLIPLIFVILMALGKEFVDDIERWKKDMEENSKKYRVLTSKGFKYTSSDRLKVGHIIEVKGGDRIPADLIFLQTDISSGCIFIQSHQLDGETDWKLKEALPYTQQLCRKYEENDFINLLNTKCSFKISEPSENIHFFEGYLKVGGEKIPVGIESTIWSNCVLASGIILGLVIYTGSETRMQINTKKVRTKIGKLEYELNLISKFLFAFMIFISTIMVLLEGIAFSFWKPFIETLRYLLLLSSIIPISLRVNLDFAKIIYSMKIKKDKHIEDTGVRNSTIPEDLGRIQFLLTDKTGTLTQNEMIFKKLSLEQVQFSHEKINEFARLLKRSYEGGKEEIEDNPNRGKRKRKIKRVKDNMKDRDNIIKDLVTAMLVCNNVTPCFDNDTKHFQSSSPDEIALVNIAEKLGMQLTYRDHSKIKIKNVVNQEETYQILENFPFTSENKKMGIIVKQEETDKITFFLKGADLVMKETVPEVQRGFLLDECENLASNGLRTLVLTQKILNEEEYEKWEKKYKSAQMTINDRDSKIQSIMNLLESEMELLGITGVEDKLQENVCQTLENLKNAGIQIWMLTGDKMETALCTAISAGLKETKQEVYLMMETYNEMVFQDKLLEFHNLQNHILVIDSISFMIALKSTPKVFFEIASRAPGVICCRFTPKQKAAIAEGIKKYCKGQIAAVGDGVNDVGMIQQADVGIGILGKEGQQAALAADYSIKQYKYLDTLLLWHGRLSYKRSALLSQFVIHRGLIISVIQAIFTGIFGFVTIPIYNGWLMMGYTTVYTMLPVFSLIFDEDVNRETALKYPPLYKTLQKGREMNVKTLLIWIWKSLYQGGVIMIMALYFFDRAFLKIVSITFSSLILTEFLNIYTELNSFHIVMVISQLLSLGVYVCSIIFLQTLFDIKYINSEFILKVTTITFISWLPLHLAKIISRRLDPTDYEKIMGGVKTKKKEPTMIEIM